MAFHEICLTGVRPLVSDRFCWLWSGSGSRNFFYFV